MTTEDITVANIKCGGCEATIKKELLKLKGVTSAEVFKEKDMVTITYEDVDRSVIVATLQSLGYPEATEKNGLLMQLKSFSSCILGKINN